MTSLAETPILAIEHETTYGDPTKLDELRAQVRSTELVREALGALQAAVARVESLHAAQASMNARSSVLFNQLNLVDSALKDALIEHHAGGDKIDVADLLRQRVFTGAEYDALKRGIAHLMHALRPEAEIRLLLASAGACEVEAAALDELANARTEKVAALLSAAAEFEGVIEFSLPATLTGALAAEALHLRNQAVRDRTRAGEMERQMIKVQEFLAENKEERK
jgi:hypothetical protein